MTKSADANWSENLEMCNDVHHLLALFGCSVNIGPEKNVFALNLISSGLGHVASFSTSKNDKSVGL